MMRLLRLYFGPALLALILATGRGVDAQVDARPATIVGTAIDQTSRLPVSGAFVTLVDSTGDRVAGALSALNGQFVLRAPAGAYRLKAERIGIDGTLSEPFELVAGQVVARELELMAEVISLEGLSVSGEQRCDLRGDAGRTVAVWAEARKALEVASWSEELGLYDYTSEVWERQYQRDGRSIVSEVRDTVFRSGQGAFRSISADSLEALGFVIGDGDDLSYYAPDASVLLSDSFLRTHCFRTVREDDRLGLEFEPAPGRELPDVEGTIWLDRTGFLDRLEFEYTNLSGLIARARTLERQISRVSLGGLVKFEGLETGGWIVREWSIRMPRVGHQVDPSGDVTQRFLDAVVEVGGVVLAARPQEAGRSQISYSLRLGAARGVVQDTTGIGPLEGAIAYLSGAGASTTTAVDGSFVIEGVRPGTYSLVVEHPVRADLGIPAPSVVVEVSAGDVVDAGVLRYPDRASVLASRCEGHALLEIESPFSRSGEPAIVGGLLRDENGLPAGGGQVRVRWSAVNFDAAGGVAEHWRGVEVPVDERGAWAACGVPNDARIEVETYDADGDLQRPFRVGLVGPGDRIWVSLEREGGAGD